MLVSAWIVLFIFQPLSYETARWTLSALVQSAAAIVAVLFAVLALLWNQSNQEQEKIRAVQPKYSKLLLKTSTQVGEIHKVLLEISKNEKVRGNAINCLVSLIHIQRLSSFLNSREMPIPDELISSDKHQYDDNTVKEVLNRVADEIASMKPKAFPDEFDFYQRLQQFEYHLMKVCVVAQELNVNKRQVQFAEAFLSSLSRAFTEDRVDIGISRIRFFKSFTGKPLSLIVSLWLLCIISGIFILLSLSGLQDYVLLPLTLLPISLGVIALGITLNIALNSIKISD